MKKLLEVKRDELLSRAKNETPERYNRRMNYVTTIKPMKMAQDLFINTGTLTVPISVGDYVVTIHISKIMKYIREELDKQNKVLPDRPLVYKAIRKAVDESDIFVRCTCPDFQYRFAYQASQKNYIYGKPETRPAKITNPYNRGSVCKHITAALVRPSQWIKFVDTWITTITKAYLQNKLNISETDIEDEIENLDKEYADVIKDEIENIQNVDDSILDKVNNNNVTVDFDEIPNEVEEETDEEVES